MYKKLAYLIISFLSIAGLYTAHASFGAEEEITGPTESFQPGYEKFSPLNGILVLESNTLANIRFNSRYGHLHQDFLCHYAITHPHGHQSTAHIDSPHDHTCSVIQQLFPSAAGGRLVLPNPSNDFFTRFPIKKVAELLVLYHLQTLSAHPDLKEFEKFFYLCFGFDQNGKVKKAIKAKRRNADHLNIEEENADWHLNADKRKLLMKLWPEMTALELAKKYALAFHGCISERSKYPVDLIESSLLAFACMKAQNQNALLPMMEVFKPYLKEDASLTLAQFNRNYFIKWKEANITEGHGSGQIKVAEFRRLLSSPDELIYLTLAENQFSSPFPKTLGTATATHTFYLGKDKKYESFSDCGESSSRSFFNFVLASTEKRRFTLTTLKENFPKTNKRFITFYEGDPENERAFFQPTFDDVNGGAIGRSAWADVVSSLNTEDDPKPVKYKTAQGRCNIAGTGLSNMFRMISKVLGSNLQNEGYEAPSEAHRRAHQLTYLLSKLSRPGYQFSWGIKNPQNSEIMQAEEIGNYPTIAILLNGEEKFNWIFNPGHFEARMSKEGGFSGNGFGTWRNQQFDFINIHLQHGGWEADFPGQCLPTSTPGLPIEMKAKLASFYKYPQQISTDQNVCSSFKLLQAYPLEMLYAEEMAGAEEQLEILDRYLTYKPELVRDLIFYWYQKFNLEDPAVVHMATALWFKYQNEFDLFAFKGEEGLKLQRILTSNLEHLKQQGAGQFLLNLTDDSYAEPLLAELIKHIDRKALIDLREEDSDDEPDDEDSADEVDHARENEVDAESQDERLSTPPVSSPQYTYQGALIDHAFMHISHGHGQLLFKALLEKAGLDIFPNKMVIPFLYQRTSWVNGLPTEVCYTLLQQPEFLELLESEATEESNFTEDQKLAVLVSLVSKLFDKDEIDTEMILMLWKMNNAWNSFTSKNPLQINGINITRGSNESLQHIPMLFLASCPLERLQMILNTDEHIDRFQPRDTHDLVCEAIKTGHRDNASLMLEHPLIRSYYISEGELTEQGLTFAKQLLDTNVANPDVARQRVREFLLSDREFIKLIIEDTRLEHSLKETMCGHFDVHEILANPYLRSFCLSEDQISAGFKALNIQVESRNSYILSSTGKDPVQLRMERSLQRLIDLLNDDQASAIVFNSLTEYKIKELVEYFSHFYSEEYKHQKSTRLRQEGYIYLPDDIEDKIKESAFAFVNNVYVRQRLLSSRPTYKGKYEYNDNNYREKLDILLTSNGVDLPSLDHIQDDSIILRIMQHTNIFDAKKLGLTSKRYLKLYIEGFLPHYCRQIVDLEGYVTLIAAQGQGQLMLPNLSRLEMSSNSYMLSIVPYYLYERTKELIPKAFRTWNLSNLRSLTLTNSLFGIDLENILDGKDLLKFTQLTQLEVPYRGSFRQVLPQLTNLESLVLRGYYVRNDKGVDSSRGNIDDFRKLTNLRLLDVSSVSETIVTNMMNIESLVTNAQFTDTDIMSLPKLTYLDVRSGKITPEGISQHTQLRTLNLTYLENCYYNKFTDPTKFPQSLEQVILREGSVLEELCKGELESKGIKVLSKPNN